jgi:hypothetical protein
MGASLYWETVWATQSVKVVEACRLAVSPVAMVVSTSNHPRVALRLRMRHLATAAVEIAAVWRVSCCGSNRC